MRRAHLRALRRPKKSAARRNGMYVSILFFFFSSRRRHTRYWRDWSSDVCSSDLGDKLVREELCHEAIRLTELLAQHRAGDQPKTRALLALMLLNAARTPAREDDQGNLLRLEEQDRTRWDHTMIARGMSRLRESAAGGQVSEYHLQAGIAACHATAVDYQSTDWARILSLYDRLVEFDDSPVVALNRS